jgi:hypothetical protein
MRSGLARWLSVSLSLLACAACSSGASRSQVNVRASSSSPSSGPPSTEAVAPPAYTLPNGNFSIATVPAGFSPFGSPVQNLGDPAGGTTLERQSFLNAALNERFEVSVSRGVTPAQAFDPKASPVYSPASQSVGGHPTYVADVTGTKETALAWAVGPATIVYVIGSHMAEADLLTVANNLSVKP